VLSDEAIDAGSSSRWQPSHGAAAATLLKEALRRASPAAPRKKKRDPS
jgi:hypothetical protein